MGRGISQAQDLTQAQLGDAVRRLASGLRVQTAADDPSGLAISTDLGTRAQAFDQAARNIQDARNALQVAEGALQTATDLLQRMRSLVVEANSDMESANDLLAVQAELDQLRAELNSIATKTQFNGLQLLDGRFNTAPPAQDRVVQVPAPPGPGTTGLANPNVVNADGLGNPGPLLQGPSGPSVPPTLPSNGNNIAVAPIYTVVTVQDFQANAVDPVAGPIGGPGFLIHVQSYSSDPNFGPLQDTITALPPSLLPVPGTITYGGPGTPAALSFTLSNLTPADVGTSIAFVTFSAAVNPPAGQPLMVHDGADEGNDVALSLPSVSSADLGIANITVLAPQVVDSFGNVSTDSSNQFAATDAEYRLDDALQTVGSARAQIGAQIVSLNENADQAQIASTALTAAQSSIRDLDVAAETTAFTRLTLTSQMQTRLLRSMNQVGDMVYLLLTASVR